MFEQAVGLQDILGLQKIGQHCYGMRNKWMDKDGAIDMKQAMLFVVAEADEGAPCRQDMSTTGAVAFLQ